MKKISFFGTILICFMLQSCCSPCEKTDLDKKKIERNQYYLTYDATPYTAKDSIYPKMIVFTKEYKNDTVKLTLENKIIYEKIITTNYSNGISAEIVLDSIINRKLFDTNFNQIKIQINTDCVIPFDTLSKYKFYYIAKQNKLIHIDHTNFYKTTY